MKKLQYKIWDKPNKTWIETPYCINQFGDLQVNNVILNNTEDFEAVLCTGKNDTNSNHIYEGHILKDDSNIYVVRFGKYQANNNRIYSNEMAYGFYIEYLTQYLNEIIDHATEIQYATIIGHELENPELLKRFKRG